jgi:hypothetical protein
MSFIPSLPISKIFQPAVSSPKRPSNNQEKVEPTKYYKKIKVISRNENDKTIIRKIDDYHTDRKTYADCHFLINQYDKILEARPIELVCSAAETIIIKTNTAIEGHTERVLERLLRDLRERYGIDGKKEQCIETKQNYGVKPMGVDAFNIILKGLSPVESEYLKLNKNNFIDARYLEKGKKVLKNIGNNYKALIEISKHKEIIELYLSNYFIYIDINTNKEIINDFGEVYFDSEYNVMWELEKTKYLNNGLTESDFRNRNQYLSHVKKWSGNFGITLHPIYNGGFGISNNGSHQIYINNRATERKQTSTTAHELYGHYYFYILNKDSKHGKIKSLTLDIPDNNIELEKQIYASEKEAEENYDKY